MSGSQWLVSWCSSKLDQVSQIFIGYHSFKNSEQSLSKLLGKLTECGFRYYIHTQFCSPRPLTEKAFQLGIDLQLNIFAKRAGELRNDSQPT